MRSRSSWRRLAFGILRSRYRGCRVVHRVGVSCVRHPRDAPEDLGRGEAVHYHVDWRDEEDFGTTPYIPSIINFK